MQHSSGWVNRLGVKLGIRQLLRIPFYPFTTLVTTPVRLVQTIWSSRDLILGKWHGYHGFTAYTGLSYLYYWVCARNFYTYGRAGRAPHMGKGDYALSKLFYFSLPALIAYWRLSPIVPPAGMFGWLLAHLVWVEEANILWVFVVTFLLAISTVFYANAFVLQNYNILGWLLFPIGLYTLLNENWWLAGLAWLLVSFSSITAVFIAFILSMSLSLITLNPAPILASLPAVFKFGFHLLPTFTSSRLDRSILDTLKAIGFSRKKAKYHRTFNIRHFIKNIYDLVLYSQFLIFYIVLTGEVPTIFIIGMCIFILNSTLLRFADWQSIQLVMVTLGAALVMPHAKLLLLIPFWLMISPLPLTLAFPSRRTVIDIVPKYAPFYLERLLEGMRQYLSPVSRGERVLCAFKDPEGRYSKVFGEYARLMQLPLFVAATREIHFFPDWWFIFEENYEGAKNIWGRDVASVLENAREWSADYVSIYQEQSTHLDGEWLSKGFKVVSKFEWKDYASEFVTDRFPGSPSLTWWLLRCPPAIPSNHKLQ